MSVEMILDGGLSRELVRFGAELKQPEWSAGALMDHPEVVRKVHEEFFRAGAEIATTANYAVVPYHIGEVRFAQQGLELADRAGRLAREAVEAVHDVRPNARVAGCLPPACGSYVPDQFDPAQARDILATLVEGLAPHVDFWLAETMSSLQEIQITTEAVNGSGKPLWIAASLFDDDLGTAVHLPMLRSRENVDDATKLAVELGAEAFLFNCSMPEVMEDAVVAAQRKIRELESDMAIGVYANAFTMRATEGNANETLSAVRTDLGPECYLGWTDRWVAAGATLIGGCCGIGTDHIAALHGRYMAGKQADAAA